MTPNTYAIDRDSVSVEETRASFRMLVDLMGPRLSHAKIDAITDGWAEHTLTPAAREAREELKRLGQRQAEEAGTTIFGRRRKRSPETVIALDLKNPSEMWLFREFAPYSIHAEAYDVDGTEPLLSMEDTGNVVIFRADDETVDKLTRALDLPRGVVKNLDEH